MIQTETVQPQTIEAGRAALAFIYATILFDALGFGLVNPALQGLMTRLVGPTEQGQLQGANSSILGFTGIIGPGLFTAMFALFIGNQAPFLLSTLLTLGRVVIATIVSRRQEFGKKARMETQVTV